MLALRSTITTGALFAVVAAQAECTDPLLRVDAGGGVLAGSREALVEYVNGGGEVRVGWRLDWNVDGHVDVVHWATANVVSILDGEVFAQFERIYRQVPGTGGSFARRGGDGQWSGVLGSDGVLQGRSEDGHTQRWSVSSDWCRPARPTGKTPAEPTHTTESGTLETGTGAAETTSTGSTGTGNTSKGTTSTGTTSTGTTSTGSTGTGSTGTGNASTGSTGTGTAGPASALGGATASAAPPPCAPAWAERYRNSADGTAERGSRGALTAALRRGDPLRVAWGGSYSNGSYSVEHVAEPVFFSIIGGEHVVVQLPEHIGQSTYVRLEGAVFGDQPSVMWRGLLRTDGVFDAVWVDRASGQVVRRLPQRAAVSWLTLSPPAGCDARTPMELAVPKGIMPDPARASERVP